MANQAFPFKDAGQDARINLPEGENSTLSFSTSDIEGMTLSDSGELTFLFKDGDRFTIGNFRSLAENKIELSMEDGEVINSQNLFERLAGEAPAAQIPQPVANETLAYELKADEKYDFQVDQKAVENVENQNGALVITFADNGILVLKSFDEAMDSGALVVTEGSEDVSSVSLREFVDALQMASAMNDNMDGENEEFAQSQIRNQQQGEQDLAALAEELAQVEPAAGEAGGAGRGGFGFGSTFTSTPLNSPEAVGPIGPTALQFGLPEFQDPLFIQEQDGPNPPPAPTLGLQDAQVYEDGSVTLAVFADPNTSSSSVTMTVTISGIPSSWGVAENGGTYNAANGTWTIRVPAGAPFTGGPTLTPPADSDADIMPDLNVTALNEDSSTELTNSSSGTLAVTTDAVADTPDVAATDATTAEDNPADLNITTAVTDTDGSEAITTVYLRGVPAGFTLSAGTDNGGGEWQLTQAELTGLQINAPADYFGTITLDVQTIAEEINKTDDDFDLTNDTAANTTSFDVTWQPVIDPPSVTANNGVDNAQVKEDGSVDVPLTASLNSADSPDAYLTVTVTGFNVAWGTATAPIGTFNVAGTEWTYTAPAGTNVSTVFTFTPNAESDIDLTGLTATATATEPATGTTADATDDFNVIVDAVADDPSLNATGDTDSEGSALDVTLDGALGSDLDGSEQITGYQISGVPAEVSFNQGTNAGGGIWTFTPAEIAGLQATHVNGQFAGSINLTATVFTTENPVSDGEFDTTDNNNSASDALTLTWTPEIDPPTITVNGGIDDVQVKEDGTVDVTVKSELSANADTDEYLSVEITGFDPAWGTVTVPVGTFNAAGDTWTITLPAGQALDTVFTFTPNAESDIDLTGLVATATATDPSESISADATDSFNVIVDAVADDPSLNATGDTDTEGSALDVTLDGALGSDLDGSEQITGYQISGVPAEVSFNQGTNAGGGIWTFTPAEIAGLQATHVNGQFAGSINLTATVFTTENPVSDGEFDTTDNNNSASDALTLTWTPEIDPPTITVNGGIDDVQVKEDGTVDVTVKSELSANADTDEYLSVEITGFDPAWGTVTVPVGTFNAAGDTWTITLPAGQSLDTVFTFTPAAESDIDLSGLTATATATDPSESITASSTDDFNVIVDAVADDPSLNATGDTDSEGSALDVTLDGALGSDLDGSEQITGYQISGVPAEVSFNQGTNAGGGIWTFAPAEIAGLQATHANGDFDGTVNLTATVFTTENPVSDGEFDTTDNNNSASDALILTWTPEIDPPTIKVNNGVDDVQVKEDGTVDVTLVAQRSANAEPAEYITVTVTGFDPAWGTATAPIGTFNPAGTEWTYTAPAGTDVSTIFTFTPNAESDIDLTGLNASVTAIDPSEGTSASANDSFNVIVDAVADAPSIDATGGAKDEGQPIDITLDGALGSDLDGSEQITGYQISGVPAGFSFNQGTNAGGGVWTFTPAEISGLQIISGDSTFDGSLNLTATVFTTENPVFDGEFDTTDNNNSASDNFTVTWNDDDQPILTQPETVTVDETDLAPTASISDSVQANFGDDAPGSFSVNGNTTMPSGLTSNGFAVTVTQSGNTYTGTANGNTVFTLTLQSDGNYTFELSGTLDHPDTGDHNDNLPLQFGVTATDSDNDTADGFITVNVLDDGLTANDDFNSFDSDLGGATGNVITGLNGGAGAADDLSNDTENTVTEISFGGTTVGVPATGTATIDGDFGTLEIAADGSYEYTLNATSGGSGSGATEERTFTGNPGEFPDLQEGVAIDASEQQSLGIADGDLSVAEGDVMTMTYVGEGAGYNNTVGVFTVAADGTILSGQILMDNVTGTVPGTEFNYRIGANAVSSGFFLIADGADINNDYAGIDFSTGSVEFVYGYGTAGERAAKITDQGGDISVVYNDGSGNETVLNGPTYYSTASDNGNLNPDGKVHVVSDLADESDNTSLRIGFEDLPNLGDEDYEDAIFDVGITTKGKADDCACGTDEFTYTLTDGDGDNSEAVLALECFEDDTPVLATIDAKSVDETDMAPTTSVSGTVTADFGVDGPGSFAANGDYQLPSGLTSNGLAVTVAVAGNTYTGSTSAGDVFTLEIGANGGYTFTLLDTIDHPDTGDHNDSLPLEFSIRANDADDDFADGTITINVFDDGLEANDDFNNYDENGFAEGNVITGLNGGAGAADDLSNDKDNTVTEVSFGTNSMAVDPATGAIIDGQYGQLQINADGSYSYQQFDASVIGTTTTSFLAPEKGDFKGIVQSYTNGGVTVSVVDPDSGELANGTMTFVDTGPHASGIAVQGNGSKKDGPADIVTVTFVDDPAEATLSLVDHGSDNFDDAITFEIYLDGSDTPVTIQGSIPSTAPQGLKDFTFNAEDLGGTEITKIQYYSANTANGSGEASFLLSDVSINVLTVPDCTEDEFVYELTDGDDDTSEAVLNITCEGDNDTPVITRISPLEVDETSLDNGDVIISDTVFADFGSDNPGSFAGNDNFSSSATLTSNGVAVLVALVGSTYVGTAGGQDVFTLEIQPDGDYTFTLKGTLDHPDMGDHNDAIDLSFGVTATDSDSDTVDGTINVTVLDDGLEANDDFNQFNTADGSANGNVITGENGGAGAQDDLSQDTPNEVTQVSYNGNTVDLTGGAATISGEYGELEIFGNGSYEYTLFDNAPSAGNTVYTFSKDNPPGSAAAGDIKNVTASINEGTGNFTFEMTIEPQAEGFTLAINGGPNPKGHGGEMALIYFDGSDAGNPVVTAYNYNGHNTQTSWKDGSAASGTQAPDTIASSLADSVFGNIEVTTDSAGNKVFSFTADAEFLQNHAPQYGDASDWTGLDFADMIGIWLHPVKGLETDYDADGYLTQWDISGQGYYDTSNQPTDETIICDGKEYAFSPSQSDITGDQTSFSEDGITVSTTDGKLTWVNTSDGSGIGINGAGSDSKKIWPAGETLDVGFDDDVEQATFTIAELGDNNDDGLHGVDYVVTLADGTQVTGEQQFVPGEIVDGHFTFSLSASDYGQDIASVSLFSTNAGSYKAASMLLKGVTALGPCEEVPVSDICDVFEYTLTDGDGDTSMATLELCGIAPKLLVGENVNDDSASTTQYRVGDDSGVIMGGMGDDVLVGDVGGSKLENQIKDINVALVLDVSGSMGDSADSNSKMALLINAVNNLLTEMAAYQSGAVKVNLAPFSTEAQGSATFTITDGDGLQDAKNFVSNLDGNGWTNYESGLRSAIDWLSGSEPFGTNAETYTYFITDGQPNRYLDDNGNVVHNNDAGTAMDQIDGTSDATNEIAQIQALSDEVIGVGIDIGSAISRVNEIDSDGNALNIDDPDDLNDALAETNPLLNLSALGDDVLEGGDGNDYMFGDSLYTDILVSTYNLDLADGSGWEAFAALENGESSVDPHWNRQDTMEYIVDNAEELGAESLDSNGKSRNGGNDTLRGGKGDDVIFGQEGDDVLSGGEGNDVIYGGSGADSFLFEALTDGLDTIMDFSTAEGDALDFSELLQGAYDALQDSINDFVFATESSGSTTLSVDLSGSGDASKATDVVTLDGLTGLSVSDLETNGSMVV